jgi:hypothetical protein
VQGKSLQEMKMAIGEKLYYIIHADHPEMSGKLTGMFLEATDSLEDLALLLYSPASLKLLLSQALDVLSVRQYECSRISPNSCADLLLYFQPGRSPARRCQRAQLLHR